MKSTTTVVLTVLLMAAILCGAVAMIDTNRYDSNGTPYPQLPLAPLLYEDSVSRVPGEYVVVFKDGVTDNKVSMHLMLVSGLISGHRPDTDNNSIIGQFQIGNLRGYGAKMNDEVRDRVRAMDIISYLESNQEIYSESCSYRYHGRCVMQENAPWGLVRTATRRTYTPSNSTYKYNKRGSGDGVTVYILDTGIDISHPDFGNRTSLGCSRDNAYPDGLDLNGHGTHVAGTVMSDTYGIAKKATAVSIPVLDRYGRGTTIGIMIGIIRVAAVCHSPGDLSIINMSFGGPESPSINSVTNFAVDLGVHVVVAAGNSRPQGYDACNYSPASASKAVTVAASDSDDAFAWFSNYGHCVDIIAPGVNINSTWLNNGTKILTGTSMAAPHVAGVMAKYLSIFPNTTPADLKDMITSTACRDQVTDVPEDTPNLLVFKDCKTNKCSLYNC